MNIKDYILNNETLNKLDFETVYRTIFTLINDGMIGRCLYDVCVLQSQSEGKQSG